MVTVENREVILGVIGVLTNGRKNPDGSPVQGMKFLTTQGIVEKWSDHPGDGVLVRQFVEAFYRNREMRLTSR